MGGRGGEACLCTLGGMAPSHTRSCPREPLVCRCGALGRLVPACLWLQTKPPSPPITAIINMALRVRDTRGHMDLATHHRGVWMRWLLLPPPSPVSLGRVAELRCYAVLLCCVMLWSEVGRVGPAFVCFF